MTIVITEDAVVLALIIVVGLFVLFVGACIVGAIFSAFSKSFKEGVGVLGGFAMLAVLGYVAYNSWQKVARHDDWTLWNKLLTAGFHFCVTCFVYFLGFCVVVGVGVLIYEKVTGHRLDRAERCKSKPTRVSKWLARREADKAYRDARDASFKMSVALGMNEAESLRYTREAAAAAWNAVADSYPEGFVTRIER